MAADDCVSRPGGDRLAGTGDAAGNDGVLRAGRGEGAPHAAEGGGSVDQILTDVRRVLALDRHPTSPARRAAAAAGAWLAIEADVATAAYDSTGDEGRGFSGLRSAGTVLRQVSFASGEESVDIEMAVTGDHVRVLGQIEPAHQVAVQALWPGGSLGTSADDTGLFRFDNLIRSPVSFHIGSDRGFKTGWIVP